MIKDIERTVEVLDLEGNVVRTVDCQPEVWRVPLTQPRFSLVHYCQSAKKHWLTKAHYEHKKTRADVRGGGIKPRRQKGTGRARLGSLSSPQLRGGGVVFGPNGQQKHLPEINKRNKKQALKEILGEKLSQGQVKILDKIELKRYKTTEAQKVLNKLGFAKSTLFVLSTNEEDRVLLSRSFQNIPKVALTTPSFLGVVAVVRHEHLLLSLTAFRELETMLSHKSNHAKK